MLEMSWMLTRSNYIKRNCPSGKYARAHVECKLDATIRHARAPDLLQDKWSNLPFCGLLNALSSTMPWQQDYICLSRSAPKVAICGSAPKVAICPCHRQRCALSHHGIPSLVCCCFLQNVLKSLYEPGLSMMWSDG